MQFARLQPDAIKYEVRQLSGTDISKAQVKKRGGFSRFLSGIGRFFGAIAAPLSFVFPPAAIGAAAMYGVSQIGDMGQIKAARKQAEQMQKIQAGQGGMGQIYIPGLAEMGPQPSALSAFDPFGQSREEQGLRVLAARNDVDVSMASMV